MFANCFSLLQLLQTNTITKVSMKQSDNTVMSRFLIIMKNIYAITHTSDLTMFKIKIKLDWKFFNTFLKTK